MFVAGVNELMCTVSAPQVKTWFIIRRLFEPEETSDVAPASSGDATAHVTVRVENAVLDGGAVKEVTTLGFVHLCLSCSLVSRSFGIVNLDHQH